MNKKNRLAFRVGAPRLSLTHAEPRTSRSASASVDAMLGATLKLEESRHGVARPVVEIRLPKQRANRRVNAALHVLIAKIELASAEQEKWVVGFDRKHDTLAYVYLELAEGTQAEVDRGIAVLTHVLLEMGCPLV